MAFELLERLGSGYFGAVWLARDTGLEVERSVKLISRVKIRGTKIFHEAQILQAAQHGNIVRIFGTGEWDEDAIYIAMDYLPKGSLED